MSHCSSPRGLIHHIYPAMEAYRISLLGVFTAPVVVVFQTIALLTIGILAGLLIPE